jgi:RNA polymerase primary sigma factor
VSANVRFVVSVAREFKATGQPLSELISDGNMGLMEAALRFDEKRGFRFITYAVWWIRQAILRSSARRRRMVTAPSNRVEDLKKVERIQTRLTQELGRSPNDDEIAHVGTPEIRLDRSLFGEEEEEDDVLSQFSTPEAPVDERLETREARDLVHRCLDILDPREREIVRCHYGFDGFEPITLEAIGRTSRLA